MPERKVCWTGSLLSGRVEYHAMQSRGSEGTVVEKGIEKNRVDFLEALLQLNQLEVVVEEVEKTEVTPEQLYNLGVTDLVFNPVIAVYEMGMKTAKGEPVTAAYWKQETTDSVKEYWLMAK